MSDRRLRETISEQELRRMSANGWYIRLFKAMISLPVEGYQRNHRHHRHSGLCGQAPSDYPKMAQYLV
jgi:fatty acid desaturase